LGIDYRPSSVEWDIVQSVLSRYPESLADFLIDTTNSGGNLGAFKKNWRQYNKKGLLPELDICAKDPLNNIKTLKWNFIDTGAKSLKDKQIQRFSCIVTSN
jgi:hypothetical protein